MLYDAYYYAIKARTKIIKKNSIVPQRTVLIRKMYCLVNIYFTYRWTSGKPIYLVVRKSVEHAYTPMSFSFPPNNCIFMLKISCETRVRLKVKSYVLLNNYISYIIYTGNTFFFSCQFEYNRGEFRKERQ